MTRMQQIVTAIGKYDSLAFLLPVYTRGDQIRPLVEFVHAASLAGEKERQKRSRFYFRNALMPETRELSSSFTGSSSVRIPSFDSINCLSTSARSPPY